MKFKGKVNNTSNNRNGGGGVVESSHEDLRLITTANNTIDSSSSGNTMMLTSPTNTTTTNGSSSGLTSPHNNNNNNHNHSTTTVIPTRFIDRRVSSGVAQTDPYKFNVNYSELGQRLAKKAQAQLKSLEKSKDADGIEIVTPQSSSSSRPSCSQDEEILGDDWQNVQLFISSFLLT